MDIDLSSLSVFLLSVWQVPWRPSIIIVARGGVWWVEPIAKTGKLNPKRGFFISSYCTEQSDQLFLLQVCLFVFVFYRVFPRFFALLSPISLYPCIFISLLLLITVYFDLHTSFCNCMFLHIFFFKRLSLSSFLYILLGPPGRAQVFPYLSPGPLDVWWYAKTNKPHASRN